MFQTEQEYQKALVEVSPFFQNTSPELGPSPERFEELMILIGEYEAQFYTYDSQKS